MTDTYIAEHLWYVTNTLYAFAGRRLDTPRYTELVHPSLKKQDNRTAEEIKQDIIRKLVG